MHIRTTLIGIIASLGLIGSARAVTFNLTTANPVIDGSAGASDWSQASVTSDGLPNGGTFYAQRTVGLTYGSNVSYAGNFEFMLHNITALTSLTGADYNQFTLYSPTNSSVAMLTVWVFNTNNNPALVTQTWLNAIGVGAYYTPASLGSDTGFVVYNDQLNAWAEYVPGTSVATPQSGDYNWADYWGIYAAGGFDGSAYAAGLAGALDQSNQLYEVAYDVPASSGSGSSSGQADSCPVATPSKVVAVDPTLAGGSGSGSTYLTAATAVNCPEPASLTVLGAGLLGLCAIRRHRPMRRCSSARG
jgi:hypothetical protein